MVKRGAHGPHAGHVRMYTFRFIIPKHACLIAHEKSFKFELHMLLPCKVRRAITI
jgi:hypothetical protein